MKDDIKEILQYHMDEIQKSSLINEIFKFSTTEHKVKEVVYPK